MRLHPMGVRLGATRFVDIKKIRWNQSIQFLGSALNASCDENEIKSGYLNMEINGEWSSSWCSLCLLFQESALFLGGTKSR